MFLRDVAGERRFRGKIGRLALLPLAFGHSFDQVYGFDMFLQVGPRRKAGTTDGATGHDPLAGTRCRRRGHGRQQIFGIVERFFGDLDAMDLLLLLIQCRRDK